MNQNESRLRVNLGHLGVKYEEEKLIYKGLDELGLEPGCNTYWCEVLRKHDLVKPMIDLDVNVETEEEMNVKKKQLKKDGRAYVEQLFGCEEEDIAISDSCGFCPDKEEKKWRISYHFVVNGMKVRWGDLKHLDGIKNKPDWLDNGIYGDRAIRMIHCSKAFRHGKQEPYKWESHNRPLKPMTHKDDVKAHIIQLLTGDETLFEVPNVPVVNEDGSVEGGYMLSAKETEILNICVPETHKEWKEIGMALKGQGCAYSVWEEWSKRSSKFKEKDCKYQWKTFAKKSAFTIATIHFWAKEHNRVGYYETVTSLYQQLFDKGERYLVEYMNREVGYLSHMNVDASYLLISEDRQQVKSYDAMIKHFVKYKVFEEREHPKPATKHNVFKIWNESMYRAEYEQINFRPEESGDGYYMGKDFNVFRGFAIPPDAAIKPEPGDIEPLLDHFMHIFCKGNKIYYEYLLNILAHVLQKPTVKTKVMVGLRSMYQGAGKNLGISHLQNIIGRKHSTALSNAKHVTGDFNAMLSGKTLVILDEAIWGGMKKDKSSIKSLISEPTVPIRLMRTDAYEEDSYHFIMAFSNEKNFWPTEQGARRDFLLECDNKYAGPQTPESKAYFDKIAAVDSAKFAHFLYNRDISKFNVTAVPITDLQRAQAASNLDSVEAWLRGRMEVGSFYVSSYDCEEARTYKWNDVIPKEVMFRMYKKEMEGGHSRPVNQSLFFKDLKAIDGFEYQDLGRPIRKVAVEKYGAIPTATSDQVPVIQIKVKVEDFVKKWNKMRNDDVVTKPPEVIAMLPEEPSEEASSPLDDGVVVV